MGDSEREGEGVGGIHSRVGINVRTRVGRGSHIL